MGFVTPSGEQEIVELLHAHPVPQSVSLGTPRMAKKPQLNFHQACARTLTQNVALCLELSAVVVVLTSPCSKPDVLSTNTVSNATTGLIAARRTGKLRGTRQTRQSYTDH